MKFHNKITPGKNIFGCLDGVSHAVMAQLARQSGQAVFIARDDARLAAAIEALGFIAPDIEVLSLPAWDCLPFDRVSPHPTITSARVQALSRLSHPSSDKPVLLITTMNSWMQKVPAQAFFAKASLTLKAGMQIARNRLQIFLPQMGLCVPRQFANLVNFHYGAVLWIYSALLRMTLFAWIFSGMK